MRLTLKLHGAGPMHTTHRDIDACDPALLEGAADAALAVLEGKGAPPPAKPKGKITAKIATATRLGDDAREVVVTEEPVAGSTSGASRESQGIDKSPEKISKP